MRPADLPRARALRERLAEFESQDRLLPGICNAASRVTFVEQLIESERRVQYVARRKERSLSQKRSDPGDDLFDPLLAAMLHQRAGNIDEAFWLTFLFVHFGKNATCGWRGVRDVYGRLGSGANWDWAQVTTNPSGFLSWLDAHQIALKHGGVARAFGAHRSYTSLGAHSLTGTGAAVTTYVSWVGPPRTHMQLVETHIDKAEGDRRRAFDSLYHSMSVVASWGRLARFDYLCMLGKLKLAEIEPGSTYMSSATGPLRGARLLLGEEHASPSQLDTVLVRLAGVLGVGMQEVEDALCNWQKSPDNFAPFRG